MPMTACHDTIAVSSVSNGIGAMPPTAKSKVNTTAVSGTLRKAATAAAGAAVASAHAPATAGDWDAALMAWARARLDAGSTDLHAEALERFDRALFDAALAHTGGHRTDAAIKLGLGRNTLTRKLGPGRRPRRG